MRWDRKLAANTDFVPCDRLLLAAALVLVSRWAALGADGVPFELRGTLGSFDGQAELEGTAIVQVTEKKGSVYAQFSDVALASVSGPAYVVTGEGYYTASGVDERAPEWLIQGPFFLVWYDFGFEVNGRSVLFMSDVWGQYDLFPSISLFFYSGGEPPTWDAYMLLLAARPLGDAARLFFRRGDVNGDGTRNLADAVSVLAALFWGATALGCEDAADANDDGDLDLADGVWLLRHLFLGGPPPPVPCAFCSVDPTEDALDCGGQEACVPAE